MPHTIHTVTHSHAPRGSNCPDSYHLDGGDPCPTCNSGPIRYVARGHEHVAVQCEADDRDRSQCRDCYADEPTHCSGCGLPRTIVGGDDDEPLCVVCEAALAEFAAELAIDAAMARAV